MITKTASRSLFPICTDSWFQHNFLRCFLIHGRIHAVCLTFFFYIQMEWFLQSENHCRHLMRLSHVLTGHKDRCRLFIFFLAVCSKSLPLTELCRVPCDLSNTSVRSIKQFSRLILLSLLRNKPVIDTLKSAVNIISNQRL